MPAYVIAEIDVQNPVDYEEYKKLARTAIEKHGGRYRVGGGKAEAIEGSAPANRLVVLEFPSTEAAKRWYYSPEYQEAVKIRHRASTARVLLVEGV
jgi:uncharacterized protein (DUF1330 family)